MKNRKTIAIVGASSRRGRWLVATYQTHYNIVALSADARISDPNPAVAWRSVELYSITSTTEALRGVDYAFYPMQNASPSTRLNQGSTRDANLLLADTFARAAEANKLQHLVFLGEEQPEKSVGWRNQNEVISVLGSRGVPITKIYVARLVGFGEKIRQWLRKRANYYVPEIPDGVLGNPHWYRQFLTVDRHRLAVGEESLLYPLPKVKQSAARKENTVRSYQRLANPQRQPAPWVAQEYFHWLPQFFRYILMARKNPPNEVAFLLFGINILQMQLIEDRSNQERQLFYVTGGLLVKRTNYGWLEFRSVLNGRYVVSALHEFVPRLPWLLYVATQAQVHRWVMNSFGKHLVKQSSQEMVSFEDDF